MLGISGFRLLMLSLEHLVAHPEFSRGIVCSHPTNLLDRAVAGCFKPRAITCRFKVLIQNFEL